MVTVCVCSFLSQEPTAKYPLPNGCEGVHISEELRYKTD
jgi:hypothetical protein